MREPRIVADRCEQLPEFTRSHSQVELLSNVVDEVAASGLSTPGGSGVDAHELLALSEVAHVKRSRFPAALCAPRA